MKSGLSILWRLETYLTHTSRKNNRRVRHLVLRKHFFNQIELHVQVKSLPGFGAPFSSLQDKTYSLDQHIFFRIFNFLAQFKTFQYSHITCYKPVDPHCSEFSRLPSIWSGPGRTYEMSQQPRSCQTAHQEREAANSPVCREQSVSWNAGS